MISHELVTIKDVCQRLGLSKTAIYARMDKRTSRFDPKFPLPIRLGEKTVRWISHEVDAYIDEQANARVKP